MGSTLWHSGESKTVTLQVQYRNQERRNLRNEVVKDRDASMKVLGMEKKNLAQDIVGIVETSGSSLILRAGPE